MHATRRRPVCPYPAPRQQGVAAIEFAISVVILMMVFFAIVTYGSLFWIKQSLSQAAGEGARAAFVAGQQGLADAGAVACLTAERSAGWLNAPASAPRARCSTTPVACSALAPPSALCLRITMDYRTGDWPLIAVMRGVARLFGAPDQVSSWVPERLTAQAVVEVISESS